MQNQQPSAAGKQRDLAALFQQKQERTAQLFEEKLKTLRFEHGQLSYRWKQFAAVAIRKVSPMSQRVSLEDFAHVAEFIPCQKPEPTLFQFGVLSNSLEAVSIEDLGTNAEEYVDLIKEATGYVRMYNERIKEIRTKVEKQAEEEFKSKIAAISSEMAKNSPLKAEA